MLRATCHCGAVRLEVDDLPDSLTECNCSVCYRYGARWAYYTRAGARVLTTQEHMVAYLCNDRVIEFYHCRHCGCLTHYEDVEKAPDSRLAVNARMFPPQEMERIQVRHFDGAGTWKFLNE